MKKNSKFSAPKDSGVSDHKSAAREQIRFSVITVSDTRTLETDKSGRVITELLEASGHSLVDRRVVKDEIAEIREAVASLAELGNLDAILTTGGTGIAARDKTPESVLPLLDGEIPGFGELFRMLSYEEIGPACILSRAFAGRIKSKLVVCLPGSTNAIKLAVNKILIPEITHLVHHLAN